MNGRRGRELAIRATAEALAAPLAGETAPLGVTAAALQEYLARQPDDGGIYQRLLPADDPVLQVDTVAEVLRVGLPLPGEALPGLLGRALDPTTPVPTAYRLLRELEPGLRRGAACGFWLALLRRHPDQEELARLSERLRLPRRGVAELPWQARRGLARLAERRAAPLLQWLERDWERLGPKAVTWRGQVALALDSEPLAQGAWAEARRWVDEARRSSEADRPARLAAAAAQAVRASAALARLAPAAGEESEAWTAALLERLPEASAAWAARAVVLAAGGDPVAGVALADGRVRGWRQRAEALTSIVVLRRDDPLACEALRRGPRPAELQAEVEAALQVAPPAAPADLTVVSWRRLARAVWCGVPGAERALGGWLDELVVQPVARFAPLMAVVWQEAAQPGAGPLAGPAMEALTRWLAAGAGRLASSSLEIYQQALYRTVETRLSARGANSRVARR